MTPEENNASAGATAAHPPCIDDSSCGAAAGAAVSLGSAAQPGSVDAPAPESAAQNSTLFVAPPSLANNPDPFNIIQLENRHWDRPVFDQKYVGLHLNDLQIYYCILRDAFHECMNRVDPNEAFSPRWRNQQNFCYRLIDYRKVLFNILDNYQADVASNLEKIQKEIEADQVSLQKLSNSPFNNANPLGREPTPQETFDELEESFKIYTLLSRLEDGMANHLTGIMNEKKPGFLLNRDNVQYFLRDTRFN
jgi:hypothetical protein